MALYYLTGFVAYLTWAGLSLACVLKLPITPCAAVCDVRCTCTSSVYIHTRRREHTYTTLNPPSPRFVIHLEYCAYSCTATGVPAEDVGKCWKLRRRMGCAPQSWGRVSTHKTTIASCRKCVPQDWTQSPGVQRPEQIRDELERLRRENDELRKSVVSPW